MKKKSAAEVPPEHAFKMQDGRHTINGPDGRLGNGFEKVGERIKLSPGRLQVHCELAAEVDGVNALIEATNRFAAKRYAEIKSQRLRWWDQVRGDLGLARHPDGERLIICGDWVTLKPEEPPDAVPREPAK